MLTWLQLYMIVPGDISNSLANSQHRFHIMNNTQVGHVCLLRERHDERGTMPRIIPTPWCISLQLSNVMKALIIDSFVLLDILKPCIMDFHSFLDMCLKQCCYDILRIQSHPDNTMLTNMTP